MGSPFKKFRIDYLLFALSAGFVLLLVLVISFTSYQYSSRELASNTSRYQRALLEEINKQLNILFDNIEQISLTVSGNIDLNEIMEPEASEFLEYQKKRSLLEYLAQFTFSSPSLQLIELYIPQPSGYYGLEEFADLLQQQELLEKPWYPMIKENDSAWIGQHTMVTPRGNEEVISFARKLYSNSRQYQGTLVIHIKAAAIKQILKGQADRGDVNRVLLDSGNRRVTMVGGLSEDIELESYLTKIEGS
ncbi:MAG: cache domain-containing protein, partial [Gorillibacterium sp.]|nr:cache domain-containing protein [Gorillibacterium sp.]